MSKPSTKRDISNSGLLNALHEAAAEVNFFEQDPERKSKARSTFDALAEEARYRGIFRASDFVRYTL